MLASCASVAPRLEVDVQPAEGGIEFDAAVARTQMSERAKQGALIGLTPAAVGAYGGGAFGLILMGVGLVTSAAGAVVGAAYGAVEDSQANREAFVALQDEVRGKAIARTFEPKVAHAVLGDCFRTALAARPLDTDFQGSTLHMRWTMLRFEACVPVEDRRILLRGEATAWTARSSTYLRQAHSGTSTPCRTVDEWAANESISLTSDFQALCVALAETSLSRIDPERARRQRPTGEDGP
jgi:hypothetical protein